VIRTVAAVTVATVLFVAEEIWRRGYGAALLFGAKQWCRARPDSIYTEDDVIA